MVELFNLNYNFITKYVNFMQNFLNKPQESQPMEAAQVDSGVLIAGFC